MQSYSQERTGDCESNGVAHGAGDCDPAVRVNQGALAILGACVGGVKWDEHQQMIGDVSAFLRNRQASIECRAAWFGFSTPKHERHSERRLQLHLFNSAARGLIER